MLYMLGGVVGWIDYSRTCRIRYRFYVLPVGLELRHNHDMLGKSRVFPITVFTYVVSLIVCYSHVDHSSLVQR